MHNQPLWKSPRVISIQIKVAILMFFWIRDENAWPAIEPIILVLSSQSGGCDRLAMAAPIYLSWLKQTLSFLQKNKTEHALEITSFRLNPHYIVWHRNFVQFSVTILIPFILLAYWNIGTALRLKQRRQNLHNLHQQNNVHAQRRTVSGKWDFKKHLVYFYVKVNNNTSIIWCRMYSGDVNTRSTPLLESRH